MGWLGKLFSRDSTKVIDPVRFNDPVANSTSWTPLKNGGANFTTQAMKIVDANRIQYRPSVGGALFIVVFIVMGIFIPLSILGFFVEDFQFRLGFDQLIPLFAMVVFTGAGSYFGYRFCIPIVFDKRQGYYWRGWKEPSHLSRIDQMDEYCAIETIHALQLISELVSSDDGGYHSFELNLILKDGGRLNVVDHGGQDRIREDAKVLSDFLNVPVWDAI